MREHSARDRHRGRSGGQSERRGRGRGHQGKGKGGQGKGGLKGTPEKVRGFLELTQQGHGFLRDRDRSYHPSQGDSFVPRDMVQRLKLRPACLVEGESQRDRQGRLQLRQVAAIEGKPPEEWLDRPLFESLTVISPNHRLLFETGPQVLTTRMIDLMTPVGRGQRALVVSPPRAGKTTILRDIGEGMSQNHPEIVLEALLVDERPEEVTDFKRSLPKCEVFASSNDRDTAEHVRLARMVIERAKRRAEMGENVFILVDSLTRIARAFNHHVGSSGRTLSGGLDSRAMEEPRKLFAAARQTEEGGSLTLIATILVDTGSRMDQLIFEEFKGTGNTEIVLDRKLAERRIFPAIDIHKSGTRKEERLLEADALNKVTKIRRRLTDLKPEDATAWLLEKLGKTPSNGDFLSRIN